MSDLKVIFRNISRQKLNTGIIIASLAIGIACINLIMMFIIREWKTDGFHSAGDRIYALQSDDPWRPGGKIYHTRFGSAEYMKLNFSQVEDFCRINNSNAQKIVANNETWTEKPSIISASTNFFNFFSYPLQTNTPSNVLEAPNSLVISDKVALKYFGTLDAAGQSVTLIYSNSEEQKIVTGVFRKPLDNTQILFDMVIPISEKDSRCYVKLAPGTDPQDVENIFRTNVETIPVIHGGTPGPYYLVPLREAYFDTARGSTVEASRDKTDLWIALVTGLMIMGIASINYLGLIHNNLIEKAKEFAIRKINGGSKWGIIRDFMCMVLTVIIISFIISWYLMLWVLPFFNKLINTSISNGFLIQPGQLMVLCSIAAFLLIITFLFSLYRIRTGVNLKVLSNASSSGNKYIQSRAFTIFQLSVSIVLLISSFIIIRQIRYITNKPIGINKEVIELKIPGQYSNMPAVFKEELEKSVLIENISITTASPLLEHYMLLLHYEDKGVEKQYSLSGFTGDENFLATLDIELIAGADFSGKPSADQNKCLVNQSLADMFFDRELIGQGIPGMEERIISGIVKDFHYSSLKSPIEPAFISFTEKGGHLMVKSAAGKEPEIRELITKVWSYLIPDYPLNMETVGERYEWYHRENKNYVLLIGSCCLISLFLSMIGIFAIAFQSSRYRTKEIGIRKVNGAKVTELMSMLNKDFVLWVMIAFVIASPVVWFLMSKWLEDFAYKAALNWWIFVLAGVMVLAVTLLTVSFQTYKAAVRNPIESLRYE